MNMGILYYGSAVIIKNFFLSKEEKVKFKEDNIKIRFDHFLEDIR